MNTQTTTVLTHMVTCASRGDWSELVELLQKRRTVLWKIVRREHNGSLRELDRVSPEKRREFVDLCHVGEVLFTRILDSEKKPHSDVDYNAMRQELVSWYEKWYMLRKQMEESKTFTEEFIAAEMRYYTKIVKAKAMWLEEREKRAAAKKAVKM